MKKRATRGQGGAVARASTCSAALDHPAVVAHRQVVALHGRQERARRHRAPGIVAHAHQQLVVRQFARIRARAARIGCASRNRRFSASARLARATQSRSVRCRAVRGRVLLVHDDAIAAAVLGRVAGGVGGAHHLRHALEVRVDDHDADADAEVEDVRAPDELEARDGLEHVVRDLQRVVRAAVLQQDAELVAAEARDDVGRAHLRRQQLAELAQQLVAGDVPAGVVHHLEAVEVEETDGVRGPGGVRQLERVLQARLELAAVLQAGERVVARVVGQLLGDRVRRGDVGERALVEQHAAVGVAHRARVLQHHELAAVLALEHAARRCAPRRAPPSP